MSIPSWFNYQDYFQNKMALDNSQGANWNALTLKAAFAQGNYTYDAEGMWQHYNDFGKAEGVSPTKYFNENEYLRAKAIDFYGTADVTENHIKSMWIAMDQADMTPFEHYCLHGAGEGLSPSGSFDQNQYLTDKLAIMTAEQKAEAGVSTTAELLAYLLDNGMTPLDHYLAFGIDEGLTAKAGGYGSTTTLTSGNDSAFGTAANDYFFANLGALNNGDYIDGGAGSDVLEAYVGVSEFQGIAVQPTVINVEKVVFRAQAQFNGGGDNANSGSANKVTVDAGNIGIEHKADTWMKTLQNDHSRASLVVEHVITDSDKMTISWKDADPGLNMDYEVYFNPQSLTSAASQLSGTMTIQLMDVKAAGTPATANTPLLQQPWDVFSFAFIAGDGTITYIKLNLDKAKVSGENATYATLETAFSEAIAAADPTNQYGLSVSREGTFLGTASVAGANYSATGDNIVISSNKGAVSGDTDDYPNAGWATTSGNTPSVGGIVWNVDDEDAQTCPLIVTNIHLDNVGRVQWGEKSSCLPDESGWGSEAGDMVVGSMADRGGVESFLVSVDRGSWISSLASTNNTLRDVVVKNGELKNNTVETKEQIEGETQLFIGRQLNDNADDLWGPASWTAKAALLSTDGLVDVMTFDASGFDGHMNLGASITAASYNKYLKDVDGQNNMGENYAPADGFFYKFGDKSDVLNMAVDSGIANDQDFYLNINMGGDNDLVNFAYSGPLTANQIINMASQVRQEKANKLVIDGDAGNDEIWTWGDGAIYVKGGEGNDAIYVGQNTDQNAVFVFNNTNVDNRQILVDEVAGAQPLKNDILGTTYGWNITGAAGQTLTVTVRYGNISQEITILTKTDANAKFVTAQTINEAIAQAIQNNEYLRDLFVAKDGAGYSLMIEALFDGTVESGDFGITFGGTATRPVDLGMAYGTEYATQVITAVNDLGGTAANGTTGADATPGTTTIPMGITLTNINAGDVISFNVNGTVYSVTATGAVADTAALATLLSGAKTAANVAITDTFDLSASTTVGSIVFDTVATGAGTATAAPVVTDVLFLDGKGNVVTATPLAAGGLAEVDLSTILAAATDGDVLTLILDGVTYTVTIAGLPLATDAGLITLLNGAMSNDATPVALSTRYALADTDATDNHIITFDNTVSEWTVLPTITAQTGTPVAAPVPADTAAGADAVAQVFNLTTTITAAPADGTQFAITVDGVEYITEAFVAANYTAPNWDDNLVRLLNTATSADGERLTDSYTIADLAPNNDGIITLTSTTPGATTTLPADFAVGEVTIMEVEVTGSDEGTNSYNIVNGGAGNDTIVLNAGSDNTVVGGTEKLINIVEFDGAFGNDVIVNFDFGGTTLATRVDLLDFSGYTGAGTLAGVNIRASLVTKGQEALTTTELGTLTGHTGRGLGFIEHNDGDLSAGGSGIYTVYEYSGNTLIGILGSITFVNSDGAFDATDIILA